MFDPQQWIDSAPKNEDATVEVAGQKIKIRRLNGSQWEQYIRMYNHPKECMNAFVLHCGLVNEKTGGPYTLEQMTALYDASPVRASLLAEEILRVTNQVMEIEERLFEEAEKNSVKTGTKSRTDATAATPGSMPEPHGSTGTN